MGNTANLREYVDCCFCTHRDLKASHYFDDDKSKNDVETKDANNFTYLSYHNAANDSGQWKVENADINSEKVKINLPASDKTVDFTITNGYYPVAVYSTDRIEKDIDKTH